MFTVLSIYLIPHFISRNLFYLFIRLIPKCIWYLFSNRIELNRSKQMFRTKSCVWSREKNLLDEIKME